MTIADRLRARLAELRMEPPELRRALAKAGLKVTRQSIHAWLTGQTNPHPTRLVVLLKVLSVAESEHKPWFEALAARRVRTAA